MNSPTWTFSGNAGGCPNRVWTCSYVEAAAGYTFARLDYVANISATVTGLTPAATYAITWAMNAIPDSGTYIDNVYIVSPRGGNSLLVRTCLYPPARCSKLSAVMRHVFSLKIRHFFYLNLRG